MSARYNERVFNIEKILLIQNLHIDQEALRECCLYGIPEKFRPLAWRLFLGYLPAERHNWTGVLRQQRAYYQSLVQNFVVKPGMCSSSNETPLPPVDENIGNGGGKQGYSAVVEDGLAGEQNECDSKNGGEEAIEDHPLALDQHSQWTGYFQDNDMLRQIENDVRRLRPEIDFFRRRTQYPMRTPISLSQRLNSGFLPAETGAQLDKLADRSFISTTKRSLRASHSFSSNCSSASINNGSFVTGSGDDNQQQQNGEEEDGEKHWEVVERILFIYSKVNVGVKYVQGMNEILGPIYYVLATDIDHEWAEYAEADAFYCFQNLMSEIQDIFIRTLDAEHCGIEAELARFYANLDKNDPKLYTHLVDKQQMKAQYFGFRWISLLLSQEFSLPDVIALWDTVFATQAGLRLARIESICLAMLEELRDQLFDGDFGQNLRLLQNFPEQIDVSILVIRAMEISDGFTFSVKEEEQLALCNNNNNNHMTMSTLINSSGLSALSTGATQMKSRFAPLKMMVTDAAAKLSARLGGGNNGKSKNADDGQTEWSRRNNTF